MKVINHDEGENARSFDIDREAWVWLVAFPEDLKNSINIAKVVSSFGLLMHWHEPKDLARVVSKVFLNDDAKIPNSVKVNAGLPQKCKSWPVPCYVLKRQGVLELRDEEAFVLNGPLHPQPPSPPRWMGPIPPASSEATPTGSNNGATMNVDGGGPGRWQQHLAPVDAAPVIDGEMTQGNVQSSGIDAVTGSANIQEADNVLPRNVRPISTLEKFPVLGAAQGPPPTLRSIVVGPAPFRRPETSPSNAKDPLVVVVPSLLKQVLNYISQNPLHLFLAIYPCWILITT
jgi:hypothetical protein